MGILPMQLAIHWSAAGPSSMPEEVGKGGKTLLQHCVSSELIFFPVSLLSCPVDFLVMI